MFLHQSQVIRKVASEGGCVIVGRCADYVLRDRPDVLKVFVYSDLENRKHRIAHIYHETDAQTLENIEKTDRKRATYYNYYSGKQFGDAQNYDLCLNSGVLGMEKCIRIIQSVYQDREEKWQA